MIGGDGYSARRVTGYDAGPLLSCSEGAFKGLAVGREHFFDEAVAG